MGALRRVTVACGLLASGVVASDAAAAQRVEDATVLLQQGPVRNAFGRAIDPMTKFKPEAGIGDRFRKWYEGFNNNRTMLEDIGDLAQAYWGDVKGNNGSRPEGMDMFTDQEYDLLMNHPGTEQAKQKLKMYSNENLFKFMMAADGLLQRTGDSFANMVSDLRETEKKEQEAWKARFASSNLPVDTMTAKHSGPTLQDLFKGADNFVAYNRAPKFTGFASMAHVPLSRFANFGQQTSASAPAQPQDGAAAAGPAGAAAMPPMAAAPQVPPMGNWAYGPAPGQPAAQQSPQQWQQWQQPQQPQQLQQPQQPQQWQQPGPAAWGAYPQVPSPYMQPMQPAQPMAVSAMVPGGPPAYGLPPPPQGMQGWAPPPGMMQR